MVSMGEVERGVVVGGDEIRCVQLRHYLHGVYGIS
jgi:hypothetical protein